MTFTVLLLLAAGLLLLLAYRFLRSPFRAYAKEQAGGWPPLLFLPAMLLTLYSYFLSSTTDVTVILLLFFTALSAFLVLSKLIVSLAEERRVRESRQQMEALRRDYELLQRKLELGRSYRHDMRHHIDTIAEYAKTGDSSAILAYIGEYKNEISGAAIKRYSANGTVNSILSVYAGRAGENSIGFSVSCNVQKELKVREIDIITILGNLLENALHGCLESGKENKSIEIHIRLQNGRLIILCNNTCSVHLKLADGLPAEKSIGISSILSVCQKYDGNLDYKIENEGCSVCAVLNL